MQFILFVLLLFKKKKIFFFPRNNMSFKIPNRYRNKPSNSTSALTGKTFYVYNNYRNSSLTVNQVGVGLQIYNNYRN